MRAVRETKVKDHHNGTSRDVGRRMSPRRDLGSDELIHHALKEVPIQASV